MRVPQSRPHIDDDDIDGVIKVLRSGNLSLGPKQTEFEKAIAAYVGTKHAVAVSSGTTGLHLCLVAAGIGPGDEVITSPFSFVASANSILYCGATPVFVDIEEDTLNMDPALVEAAITPRTKAILAVHIFGHACDIDAINAIAKKHNLIVIEDACEALGATIAGRKVGTHGNMAVFAFYPNKQMTTGEGGAIVTDDEKIHLLLQSLKNQGRSDDGNWLTHSRLGYNYRLTDIQCSLGITQLAKLDTMLKMRKDAADRYTSALRDTIGIRTPSTRPHCAISWFVYVIRCKPTIDRNRLLRHLMDHGIGAKPYLPSIHKQPYMQDLLKPVPRLPISEKASSQTISLPLFADISAKEQSFVVQTLLEGIDVQRR
ncbi:MAG: DegT/DnrJ/EryC1/StrS family aminotransferase [Nanoarchaeota archaeon]